MEPIPSPAASLAGRAFIFSVSSASSRSFPRTTPMIIRKSQVETERNSKEGWGTVDTLRYSDAGALTHFGASVKTLLPGAKSSIRHWHENTDEFLFVLSGEVTVTEDDGPHVLRPGDSACWPAGVPNGHTVSNKSSAPCAYLIVGTRVTNDIGHYVDDVDLPPGSALGHEKQ